jgi:hypothetical protein
MANNELIKWGILNDIYMSFDETTKSLPISDLKLGHISGGEINKKILFNSIFNAIKLKHFTLADQILTITDAGIMQRNVYEAIANPKEIPDDDFMQELTEAYRDEATPRSITYKEIKNNEKWDVDRMNTVRHQPMCVSFNKINYTDECAIEDMPIKMSGNTDIHLPDFVPKEFVDTINATLNYDKNNFESFKDMFVYLTITSNEVQPGHVQRVSGWHVDGYQKNTPERPAGIIQHQYSISNELPTIFYAHYLCAQLHQLPKKEFFKQLSDLCEAKRGGYIATEPYEMYLLNSFCPHKPAINRTDKPIQRWFMRISFSLVPFTNEKNTKNPLIDYTWTKETKATFYK